MKTQRPKHMDKILNKFDEIENSPPLTPSKPDNIDNINKTANAAGNDPEHTEQAIAGYYRQLSETLTKMPDMLKLLSLEHKEVKDAVRYLKEIWKTYKLGHWDMMMSIHRQLHLLKALAEFHGANIDVRPFDAIGIILSEMDEMVTMSGSLLRHHNNQSPDLDYINSILPALEVSLNSLNESIDDLVMITDRSKT